jgi:hypothetical protein
MSRGVTSWQLRTRGREGRKKEERERERERARVSAYEPVVTFHIQTISVVPYDLFYFW